MLCSSKQFWAPMTFIIGISIISSLFVLIILMAVDCFSFEFDLEIWTLRHLGALRPLNQRQDWISNYWVLSQSSSCACSMNSTCQSHFLQNYYEKTSYWPTGNHCWMSMTVCVFVKMVAFSQYGKCLMTSCLCDYCLRFFDHQLPLDHRLQYLKKRQL